MSKSQVWYGTVDGQRAKFVYHADRRQTHIFWGGFGRPDNDNWHNHAIINDDNPIAFRMIRENGVLVTNLDAKTIKEAQSIDRRLDILQILRTSLRNALRYWGMGS